MARGAATRGLQARAMPPEGCALPGVQPQLPRSPGTASALKAPAAAPRPPVTRHAAAQPCSASRQTLLLGAASPLPVAQLQTSLHSPCSQVQPACCCLARPPPVWPAANPALTCSRAQPRCCGLPANLVTHAAGDQKGPHAVHSQCHPTQEHGMCAPTPHANIGPWQPGRTGGPTIRYPRGCAQARMEGSPHCGASHSSARMGSGKARLQVPRTAAPQWHCCP